MTNRDLDAAWLYHNATKHSYWSIRANAHFLDWPNQPLPFKIYSTIDPLPLPRDFLSSGSAALSALAPAGALPGQDRLPDLLSLARILYFSAGITRRKKYAGGEILFRAASCTGALYEIELYLVCADLPNLDAGVYHFNPGDFALRRLRAGDYRRILVQAAADEPSISHAPVVIVCTGTYWRNSWKYQARTYRHFGWDNGTLLANLLAMVEALNLPARLLCGFVDDEVNRLLDLDSQREVAFSMLALGSVPGASPAPPGEVRPLDLPTVPLSNTEVEYPEMREIHQASSLISSDEVAAWRGRTPVKQIPIPTGPTVSVRPGSEEEVGRESIETVILRRGSTRRFAREPVTFTELSTMLDIASRNLPADFLDPPGSQLNDVYLIVNDVENLAPGAYFFHRDRRELECLKEGNFRRKAYSLGLEQDLPGDASVDVFFLSDLSPVLERFGNRGYRAVQLESGILGGRLYLAAYAQRLGATGLTFYDDDVSEFFSPHAKTKSAIFLMALGKSAKRQLG